jgi:beta-lactamase class A
VAPLLFYYFQDHLSMPGKFLMMLFILTMLLSCQCHKREHQLTTEINAEFSKQKGNFAVAFKDLTTGEEFFINERESFHAASTMKTPVMIEVFKQASEGKFSLTDCILVKNEFKSIVDNSPYALSPEDDSEQELYKQAGKKRTLSSLVYDMIIMSSNLATNIVIEKVGAKNVTQTMRELGANDIQVLRGVEDSKAYEKGMNNTTTAYDLMLIFEKIGKEEMVSTEASRVMTKILLDQHFNDIIPAKLPADVKVAHKTGSITGLHHDSGIVFLPDGRKYILVLLSKSLEDEKAGIEAMATVSELLYKHITAQ